MPFMNHKYKKSSYFEVWDYQQYFRYLKTIFDNQGQEINIDEKYKKKNYNK